MTKNGCFTIGEVAGMLGVARRRVDKWVCESILRSRGRSGRWKLVPLEEVELAQRVLRFARRHGFGDQIPRGLFDHMRTKAAA